MDGTRVKPPDLRSQPLLRRVRVAVAILLLIIVPALDLAGTDSTSTRGSGGPCPFHTNPVVPHDAPSPDMGLTWVPLPAVAAPACFSSVIPSIFVPPRA